MLSVCFHHVFFSLLLLLVDGHWSAWGSFGPCSRSCGSGKQYRRRACNNPAPSSGGSTCNGPSHQSKACNIRVCAGRYCSSIQLPDGANLKGLVHDNAHARRLSLQNKFVGSTLNSKSPLPVQSLKILRFIRTSVALAGLVILR